MRLIVAIILLIFLPGIAVAFAGLCVEFANNQNLMWPIIAGGVAGIVLDQIFFRRIRGFETFEHELTHAIAALMMLRKIKHFVVTRNQGGWVQHQGSFGGELGSEFIGLAPYIMPTFTVFSVLPRPFLPIEWFPWFDVWIGLTLGFHTWSTMREIRRNWHSDFFTSAGDGELTRSDLGSRGLIYSGIYIVTVTLAIHSLLFTIVLGGFSGVRPWATVVWAFTSSWVMATPSFFEGLLTH